MMRVLTRAVLLAAVTTAAGGCGSERFSSSGTGTHPPKQIGAALDRLSAEGGQLLEGGPAAFKARVSSLRGVPVVVNQWASWCGPCKFEFPFFGALARKYEGEVAFLGVNSQDAEQDARDFLADNEVPFPHYFDQDVEIARLFGGGRAWPTTAFYDRRGRLAFTHAGAYKDEAALEADIRRYALDG